MSNLYWYIHQSLPAGPPSQIYPYPVHPKTSISICPQTNAFDKRVIDILSPFDLLIQRAADGNYVFESNDVNYMHIQRLEPVLLTKPPSKGSNQDENVHIAMPYVFLSDNKNLVGYQMSPNFNTKNVFENTTFIEGVLPVGRYGRILDLALNVKPSGTVILKKNEPLWRFVFTDEVKLIHIDPTYKIEKYVQSISRVTNYTKGVKNIFYRASITYPYKELNKCEILDS